MDESPFKKSLESLFEEVPTPTKTGHQNEAARFYENTLSYVSPGTKKLHSDIKNSPENLSHHNNDTIQVLRFDVNRKMWVNKLENNSMMNPQTLLKQNMSIQMSSIISIKMKNQTKTTHLVCSIIFPRQNNFLLKFILEGKHHWE